MPAPFRVLTTPAFERQARKAVRGKQELASVLEKVIPILADDPHNATGKHKIKKLTGVAAGEGQWRIRFGAPSASSAQSAAEGLVDDFDASLVLIPAEPPF